MGSDWLVLKQLFPFLVPIAALMIPIVAIVMTIASKMRRDRLMHETVRQFAEKGLPVPPELFAGRWACERADGEAPGRSNTLRDGAVSVAAGLGLGLMFYMMRPDGWLWAIGSIPLFVGVAMLIVWRIERSKPAAP
jgi:hypothetical protein